MARVKLIEPATGATVEVEDSSPLAELWQSAEGKSTTKRSSSKSSK